MDQTAVAAFEKDMKFEGFLLARSSEQRASSNGSKYLDMTLCDRTGEINAKMWDGTVTPPKTGAVVKVRAQVTEYNGRLQLRINKVREATEDEYDVSFLVPCAPYPAEQMLGEITDTVAAMKNGVLRGIVGEMLLLYAGVIVHDLSKISEMKSDEAGNVTDYTTDGLLLGHLVRGVTQVREAARRLDVPEDDEYVLLLEHMVISHHGEAEFGSPRPPMFPEAEMLHWIDLVDARMNEMNGILRRTPAGAFSEKIWSLDRRVYHPRYTKETEETKPEKPQKRPDADAAYQGLL